MLKLITKSQQRSKHLLDLTQNSLSFCMISENFFPILHKRLSFLDEIQLNVKMCSDLNEEIVF